MLLLCQTKFIEIYNSPILGNVSQTIILNFPSNFQFLGKIRGTLSKYFTSVTSKLHLKHIQSKFDPNINLSKETSKSINISIL